MRLAERFRAFSAPARAFLTGAALLEIGRTFQWVLQNLYVVSLGHSVADVGIVNAFIAAGTVMATFPAAWLYERLGPRRSLMAACTLDVAGLLGVALSTGLPALMGWSFLTGMGYTLHSVVSAPFLVGVSTPRDRTHLFQWEFAVHTFVQMIALLISCLIAGLLEQGVAGETAALRWALLAGGSASLVALVPYRRLPLVLTSTETTEPARILAILRPDHWHLWTRICAPHFLIGVGAGLSIPFINLYFTDRFELPKAWLGVVMAASSATMTFGALVAPRLVARIGLLRATILSEALSIPFFLVLAFTVNLPLAVAAFVLRGALMNLSHPLWRNLMMAITPERWRPTVNGLNMLAWNLGWATSTWYGGVLIDESAGSLGLGLDGYALPMLVTIGSYVMAIVLEAIFFWRHREIGMAGHVEAASPTVPPERE